VEKGGGRLKKVPFQHFQSNTVPNPLAEGGNWGKTKQKKKKKKKKNTEIRKLGTGFAVPNIRWRAKSGIYSQ